MVNNQRNPLQKGQNLFAQNKIDSTIIAIGASTGGTESVLKILKEFPANSPAILIVQHMPPVFTKMYADRLDKICNINVKEACHKDEIKPGWAYLAPGDLQMRLISENGKLFVNVLGGEKVSGHKPSVDVLFKSVANVMGKKAIGVIMTGMGKDGAKGLLEMKNAGAYTIGENEETCVVYGMPMEAKKIGAVKVEVPLTSIYGIISKNLHN